MSSVLECSAEPEIYFKDNWTLTPLQVPDPNEPFDTTGLDSYIRINYVPNNNEHSGLDRISSFGTTQIFCYHKKKKLALKLADDVKTFFNCKDLPKDIHIDIGSDSPCIDLENGFYMSLVSFPLAQYS